jgi:hypothetical protein
MAGNSLRLLCLSVAAWGLLAIPSAHAATSTLGQLGNNSPCGGFGYSEVETGVGGAPGYVAPSDGMLTSWSILGNADTNDVFKMRVFRPTSTPGQFEVVADSTEQGPLTPSVINGPFPTNIPVKAGDLLGLNVVAGTNPPCDFSAPSSDDVMQEFNPDAASVGQTETSTSTFIGFRANVSATFTPQPGISSLSPSSGPRTGGTRVTITGHDLTGATAVSFGSRPAASFTINSDSKITAVAPPETPGAVDVGVSTPAGKSPAAAADKYTFKAVCVVPNLEGKTLKKAKKRLRRAHCRLGKVRPKAQEAGKVEKEHPKPGRVRAAGHKVSVKLG